MPGQRLHLGRMHPPKHSLVDGCVGGLVRASTARPWAMKVQIIKHEAASGCGSYEVRFADGRPSLFFYWDDRLRSDQLTSEKALELAKAIARAAQDS